MVFLYCVLGFVIAVILVEAALIVGVIRSERAERDGTN